VHPRRISRFDAGETRALAKKYTSNPIGGMGDVFGEPEVPAGFRYLPDVISSVDEKSLVQRFVRHAQVSFYRRSLWRRPSARAESAV
jgi:hypothetical protein